MLIKVIFYLFFMLSFAGCFLSPGGDSDPDCAVGEAFDHISRTCSSEGQTPVPKLNTISINEDEETTVTLEYVDAKGRQANNCSVTNVIDTKLDIYSPLVSEAASKAQEAATAASNASTAGSPYLGVSITIPADDAQTAADDVASATTHSQRLAALELAVSKTKEVGELAQTVADVSVQTLGINAVLKAQELEQLKSSIANRCFCQAGVCETVIKPVSNFNGDSGFSYSLSSAESGESSPIEVGVIVVAVDDLPMVHSFSIFDQVTNNFYLESDTSVAETFSFTVPLAEEIDEDDFLLTGFYNYEVTAMPTNGVISDCMGLDGSAGSDRNCKYVPSSGDTNGVGIQAAVTLENLEFYASANGTWGNDITIEFAHKVGVGANPEIALSEKAITIYIEKDITKASDVYTAITNNSYIKTLIFVDQSTNASLSQTAVVTGQDSYLVQPASSVNLAGGTNGMDQIVYRSYYNGNYSGTGVIDISVTAVDDIPVINADDMMPIAIDEDQELDVTIDWTDPEGDNATACSVSSTLGTPNFDVLIPCSCDASTPAVCTFKIVPIDDFSGTITDLVATVTTASGTSDPTAIYIDVNAANDAPFPAFMDIDVTESVTSVADEYDFTITDAYDPDSSASSLSYILVTDVSSGTLSNCLGKDGSSLQDLSCTYIPDNGNMSGAGSASTLTINDLQIDADFDGVRGDDISIEFIDDTNMAAGDVRVENDVLDITVYFSSGTVSATDLAAAINNTSNNPVVPTIITATVSGVGGNMQVAAAKTNLAGGAYGVDYFTYRVSDSVAAVSQQITGVVNINISPTNDSPVLCSYSKFKDAPECGLNGCIGDTTPYGNLTPSKSGIIYYLRSQALCYKSTGTTSSDWESVGSTISDQYVNEKDVVVIDEIKVDEGGGDSSENAETITITDVTSSNTVLIPIKNIKIYFDGSSISNITAPYYPISFGSAASEDDSDFKIVITPAGGVSGESTITINIEDTGTPAKSDTVSFKVTVYPVSATHQGWKDVKATGPKVNKHGEVLDHNYVCTYSRTKCTVSGGSGNECQGSGSPTSLNYQADEEFVIYYDQSNEACYYSEGTGSGTAWTQFDSFCAITPSDYASECSSIGASCIGDGAPTFTPTQKDFFYYDKQNDSCYHSVDTTAPADWATYNGPGEVTIRWEDFLISGSAAITGFNVYRRVANAEFDYDMPINKDTIITTVDKYIDNEVNSYVPPAAGTVYYYEVRPIINNIPTGTNEVYKTLRVTVPPDNMSFVHRWMANKTICDLLHATDTDPTNNYRCSYIGPGDNGGYYDIGEDLLVDRYEAACNYTASPACDTAEGSCVGNFAPQATVTADINSIFYNRNNGKCYINTDGATSWSEIDETAATLMGNINVPENPPLVYLRQEQAANFCATSSNLDSIMGITQVLSRHLPTRKQQIAYTQWDTLEKSNATITSFETGLSINTQSKCNSSSASGLSQYYSDSQIPDSNTFYTVPGTGTSAIRSLMTGSYGNSYGTYGTEGCQSKFNIQDAVGNVSEWSMDRVTCSSPSTCSGVLSGDANAIAANVGINLLGTNDDLAPSSPYAGNYTAFGVGNVSGQSYYFGPCSDTNADNVCDAQLTQWKFEEERFGANSMIVPMGIPVHEDYTFNNSSDAINSYIFEIGPTAGITTAALHDDGMILNTSEIFADANKCGAIAGGGSYLQGADSGTYFMELVPCTEDSGSYTKASLVLGDVSFKSISTNGSDIYVNLIDPGAASQVTSAALNGSTGIDITLGTDASADINATAQDIVDAVNGNGALNVFVEAVVSGEATRVQNSVTSDPVYLNATSQTASRVDIGFRCVTPVTGYDE